jgi:hypothetical protein
MNSFEFDQHFDQGDSVLNSLDFVSAQRPRLQQKRVNVDFPLWMVEQLDREATRRGRPQRNGLVFDALTQLGSQSSADHQIHRNAEEILKRQLEIHALLKAGAGGEFHQQIKVAPWPCRTIDHRAEHPQAMGSCDALQRRR